MGRVEHMYTCITFFGKRPNRSPSWTLVMSDNQVFSGRPALEPSFPPVTSHGTRVLFVSTAASLYRVAVSAASNGIVRHSRLLLMDVVDSIPEELRRGGGPNLTRLEENAAVGRHEEDLLGGRGRV